MARYSVRMQRLLVYEIVVEAEDQDEAITYGWIAVDDGTIGEPEVQNDETVWVIYEPGHLNENILQRARKRTGASNETNL